MRLLAECRFAPHSETDLLAVRHGLPVADRDGNWYESFAPSAWLNGGRGARVTLGHDGLDVGHVGVVIARGAWHIADLIIEESNPLVLHHVKVGQPVSLDARSFRRDDDDKLRLRRHNLAKLDAIALLDPGQIPGYQGARITSIREMPARVPQPEREVIEADRGILIRNCGTVLGIR